MIAFSPICEADSPKPSVDGCSGQRAITSLKKDVARKLGDIDILATRRDWLVAVQVKVRATHADALQAVTWWQRRRIERALKWYLRTNPRRAKAGIRFDVFTVALWRLPSHIENAWRHNEKRLIASCLGEFEC